MPVGMCNRAALGAERESSASSKGAVCKIVGVDTGGLYSGFSGFTVLLGGVASLGIGTVLSCEPCESAVIGQEEVLGMAFSSTVRACNNENEGPIKKRK